MRTHRFYFTDSHLQETLTVYDQRLVHQWLKVFRFQVGQSVVLFDGAARECIYRVTAISKDAVTVQFVADAERIVPNHAVTLAWSLLKNDHNDLVLEKATELGVTDFVPIIAERTIKSAFNAERARRITIEASEQCGRSDIPRIHGVQDVRSALHALAASTRLFVAQQGSLALSEGYDESVGVLIGPEGGWSPAESALFTELQLPAIGLGQFVLRAETAAITAAATLCT